MGMTFFALLGFFALLRVQAGRFWALLLGHCRNLMSAHCLRIVEVWTLMMSAMVVEVSASSGNIILAALMSAMVVEVTSFGNIILAAN